MPKPYPQSIVPQCNYRYRLPMRKLLADLPELAVVRRSSMKDPFAYSSSGNVKELRTDAIEDLQEMSVNLLGGSFKMKHLPFAPSLDLVKDEWDGHSEPSFPLSEGDYKVEEEWGIIGFRVSVVNSFAFPYTKAVDKKDYANVVKVSERIRKREKLDIDGEIVGMFGQADNQMTTVHAWLHVNQSGEARRIRHRFREFLSRIAICEFGYSYHIGSKYYQHGAGCMTNLFDDGLNNLYRSFVRYPKV